MRGVSESLSPRGEGLGVAVQPHTFGDEQESPLRHADPKTQTGGEQDGSLPPCFDLDALFVGLAKAPALLLAVSGGPDSIALMHLAARWAAQGGPALHVASVDHGLRAVSSEECASVGEAAAALGLPHATLQWRGPKPATRIQERARHARYTLLAERARAIGATHVLTAHHADDQAETVLLRLGRGSGLAGLAGMRRETALGPDLTLVRPLLIHAKADLVALCRHEDFAFIDDPSNADPAYARARLRGHAAARAVLGLGSPMLTRLARRMARADDALEAEVSRLESSLSFERHDGGIFVSLRPATGAAPEIVLRLLKRTIERVVVSPTIRLERLETLADAIVAALAAKRTHRATLGGARLVLGVDTRLVVTKEAGRRGGNGIGEG